MPDVPKKSEMKLLTMLDASDDAGCGCGEPGSGPKATAACCGPPAAKIEMTAEPSEQSFVCGSINTAVGPVPQISPALTAGDRRGARKARWGIGRMDYLVVPGLYAVGSPTPDAPVLVTANYKMSFDRLRESLSGRDAWILVLDTKGINVWCAAGKGTFGTDELVRRIALVNLGGVVNHGKVILPQLGAPGVAAHQVKQQSGFKVIYGPIEAVDIPAFLDAGGKATPKMREKRFPIGERVALIPMEVVPAFKWLAVLLPLFFFLSGLKNGGGYLGNVLGSGVLAAVALTTAVIAGAVLVPLLLPWLPGRGFSTKGIVVGLVMVAIVCAWKIEAATNWSSRLELLAWGLVMPMVSAYLAMNFTGASTYTSLSGVTREMRRILPVQIGAVAIGLGLWITARFVA